MKRLLLCTMLLGGSNAIAQRETIDSLNTILRTSPADTTEMKICARLGKEYLHISGDTAIQFATRSLVLARRYRKLKTEAECYSLIGVVNKDRGNYDTALRYHLSALKIKEALHDEKGLATTHNDIGVLLKIIGRYDDALAHYRLSNELCRKLGIQKGVAMTYNNIGTIFREKRKLDSALAYYLKGLHEAEILGDSYSIATCLTNVGDAYAEKGNNRAALNMFLRSLQYDKANEDKPGMTTSYFSIARVLGALKRYDEALRYSDSAIAMSFVADLRQERMTSYAIRAGLEQATGNYAAALEYQQKLMSLQDSIMNEEINRQISELQTKYETQKKEQQIALQRAEIKKKNYLIGGTAGVFALTVLLSYSYYRRYKLKQQARLQQAVIHQQELATFAVIEAEEKERKRIAGDLHDGVGQLMSAAKMNLSVVAGELSFASEDQRSAFDKAIALVDEGCREVRTVSHNIMPNALLKSGLSSAIREFISKIDQRIINVNLYSEGLNERINGNLESVLYRIVQECVNNVIKHAGATQLDISLIRDEEGISLTIEDNGRGFNIHDKMNPEGIGLKNIRSRAEYLKGIAEWNTAPGQGTVVMVHVPLT